MIERIHIQDFKAHRSTHVPLGRFTMLVGDNASGKTSVLDALWLQSARRPSPAGILQGDWSPEDLLRREAEGPIVFMSSGTTKGQSWETRLSLERSGDMDYPWRLELDGVLEQRRFDARSWPPNLETNGSVGWERLRETVGVAGFYRLRADKIAAAAYSSDPAAFVELDGTNTAVALAAMKLGDDEAFDRVEDAIRTLIPAVERVRIRPAKVQHPTLQAGDVVGSKLYFDFRGAPGVPGHNASHGTLIALALLTILHSSRRPHLILLDDFDHALHPRAQIELVRMIKGLLSLDEFKDVQVVATTHSPYVLDELDPSEVQVFALRDDGTVASKRLSEHPEAEQTKGMLRAGQLWSLDPERDWVLRDSTP